MDREEIYERQKIDCNCNDCGFMQRDFDAYAKSVALHEKWQHDYFQLMRSKKISACIQAHIKKRYDAAVQIGQEAIAMKYQFDKSAAMVHFGKCSKFERTVSFIPNNCQIETQQCFVHRKDLMQHAKA